MLWTAATNQIASYISKASQISIRRPHQSLRNAYHLLLFLGLLRILILKTKLLSCQYWTKSQMLCWIGISRSHRWMSSRRMKVIIRARSDTILTLSLRIKPPFHRLSVTQVEDKECQTTQVLLWWTTAKTTGLPILCAIAQLHMQTGQIFLYLEVMMTHLSFRKVTLPNRKLASLASIIMQPSTSRICRQ